MKKNMSKKTLNSASFQKIGVVYYEPYTVVLKVQKYKLESNKFITLTISSFLKPPS